MEITDPEKYQNSSSLKARFFLHFVQDSLRSLRMTKDGSLRMTKGGFLRMTGKILGMIEGRRQEVGGRRLRSGHCYFIARINFHSLNCSSLISDISTSENWPEFLK